MSSNILFYLGHPAHFHLFKNVFEELKQKHFHFRIFIKKKDILEDLLEESSFQYENIQPRGRRDGKLGIALGLLERDYKLLFKSLRFKPDLLVGTSVEIAHVGKLIGKPAIVVNEDDHNIVPLFSKLGYPFADSILSPSYCNNGKWEHKSFKYDGFQKLAYLHPRRFTPRLELIKDRIDTQNPYFLLRFAKLTAHHDEGKTGITTEIAHKIVQLLLPHGNIYITSERKLEPEFEKYRLQISPSVIHHVLSQAQLYIGDSQSMAVETAILGVPGIRFNDFAGEIGVLEELEHRYGLTYGIKTSESEKLLQTIKKLIGTPNIKEEWQKRRLRMLKDKIDVTAFFTWFIENYPESKTIMRENPDFQYNFR